MMKTTLICVFVFFSKIGFCDVMFFEAYRNHQDGANPTVFKNDSTYKFSANKPIVKGNEIIEASYYLDNGQAVVKLRLTHEAIARINKLARNNAILADNGNYDDLIGLGMFVDAKPLKVIQGVYDELPNNEMHLYSYGESIDESENEAKRIVESIQRNSNQALKKDTSNNSAS